LLDFPTEDYEVFTTEEIEELNEALGTANLSENEIWDVISGMESVMEEEFALTGKLEEGTRLEISFEEAGIVLEIASQETGAIVMESPMVKETFSGTLKEKPIETLKEEMVAMVQEEMPFMAMMETTKPPIEKMKEEVNAKTSTPKEALPMVSKKETISPTKKEETQKITKAPPSMKTAKEEKPVEKKPTEMVKRETKNEEKKEEAKEEKPTSETTSKSTTETANREEQEGVQSEKAQVTKLELVMKKVDAKIKNPIKNLAIKNLIKLDIMMGDKDALLMYQNAVFYEPKDIYLEQLNIFDQRQIYANVSLATYVNNDKVAIKANILHELNLKKQRLLIELEQLKNG
jgi:outer membrane biosynthesis protein TonB